MTGAIDPQPAEADAYRAAYARWRKALSAQTPPNTG